MKKYVEFFLELKIKNTKAYTQDECDEMNRTHQAMGFTFVIKPEETCKNKGLRAVAKLCLILCGASLAKDAPSTVMNILASGAICFYN